jgi:hypothetical protein
VERFDKSIYRHRRGVHRLAACLAPNRQVSEQLRGYLSPGGSSIGLDYTHLRRDVKRGEIHIITVSSQRRNEYEPRCNL